MAAVGESSWHSRTGSIQRLQLHRESELRSKEQRPWVLPWDGQGFHCPPESHNLYLALLSAPMWNNWKLKYEVFTYLELYLECPEEFRNFSINHSTTSNSLLFQNLIRNFGELDRAVIDNFWSFPWWLQALEIENDAYYQDTLQS